MQMIYMVMLLAFIIAKAGGQICMLDDCQTCNKNEARCTTRNAQEPIPQNIHSSITRLWVDYEGPPTSLKVSMLTRYPHIESFTLSGNITKIEGGTLAIPSLQDVTIQVTLIEKLPADIFGSKSALKYLNLPLNKLHELPSYIFGSIPDVISLNLAGNPFQGLCKQETIGQEFKLLKNLQSLSLTGVGSFDEDCANVTEEFLRPLSFLKELDLSRTKFFMGSQKILKPLQSLRSLAIDNLGPYKECPALADELLENLPNNVESIRMWQWQSQAHVNSSCVITDVILAGLQTLKFLTSLDFSDSRGIFGTTLTSSLFNCCTRLTDLNLSGCQLTEIEPGALDNLPINSLSLIDNEIDASNNLDQVFGHDTVLSHTLRQLNLAKNELAQNFYGDWSVAYNAASIVTAFPNLDMLTLSFNSLYLIPIFKIGAVRNKNFSITYLDLSKNSLDKLAGDNMRDLCYMATRLDILYTANNYISDISDVCLSLKRLYLSSNRLGVNHETNFHRLTKLIKLEYLYLEDNDLRYVPEYAFTNMVSLKSVDLSENKLSTLDDALFASCLLLYSLHLESNTLSSLELPSIMKLTELSELDISNNLISTISEDFVDFMDKNLTSITVMMKGNPFDCSCERLFFQEWVKTSTNVYGGRELVCLSPSYLLGHPIFNYEESYMECYVKTPLIAAGVILGVIIITVLAAIPCYRYRWYITHMAVIRRAINARSRYVNMEEFHEEYKYDVMICMDKQSSDDIDWVVTKLLPELEGGVYPAAASEIPDDRKNNVYLHLRDALPGSYRFETLCEVMKQSGKIILVISNSFLGNPECLSEAMYAGEELYGTKTYKPERILVLILEELREDLVVNASMSGLLTETVIDVHDKTRDKERKMKAVWKKIHSFVDRGKGLVYRKPTATSAV